MAVALVLAHSLPAAAATHTRTSRSGAVTATVTWKDPTQAIGYPHDYRVRIVRAGRTLVNGPVRVRGHNPDPRNLLRPAGLVGERPVAVRDMDHDGEPEVLVEATTSGAHCCETTKLWFYAHGGYSTVEHRWNNQRPRLGATLLHGADDWSYAFGSYVASARRSACSTPGCATSPRATRGSSSASSAGCASSTGARPAPPCSRRSSPTCTRSAATPRPTGCARGSAAATSACSTS